MDPVEVSKMQIGQRGVRTRGAVHEVVNAIIVGKSSVMQKSKQARAKFPVRFQNPLKSVNKEKSFQRIGKMLDFQTSPFSGLSGPVFFFELLVAVYKIGIWVLTAV